MDADAGHIDVVTCAFIDVTITLLARLEIRPNGNSEVHDEDARRSNGGERGSKAPSLW